MWHCKSLVSYVFRSRFSSRTGRESISWLPNWLLRNPILVKNNTTPFMRLVPNYAQKFRSTSCVNPFLRRLYHVDRNNVHHFKFRGLNWWIRHPGDAIAIASVGGCAMYATNLETVPYTNRRHLVLVPSHLERWLAEWAFKRRKSGMYEGRILPASHPDDVRVQKIAKDIIGATRRVLREDRHCRAQTAHVEEFDWEVIVVDNPIRNAYCSLGGKIVVNTGLLRESKSDDEIAGTIGHEVGHAVGRHQAERLSRVLVKMFIKYFLSAIVYDISNHFLKFSQFRRCEREADYIGLFLTASAGYDPRAALEKWERRARKTRSRSLWYKKYRSTHPPHKERAQLLSKIMEEALSIYNDAISQKIN